MRSRQYYESLLSNPNVQRGLAVIRATEGTAGYSDPYAVTFGGRTFDTSSGHPGTLFDFTTKSGTKQRTSAHGAYQFLSRTWNGVASKLGLENMSPVNQDVAALALIDGRGGLDNLVDGDLKGFVKAVGPEWASLPTAPSVYDQPTKSWQFVEGIWNKGGQGQTMLAAADVPVPSQAPRGLAASMFPDISAQAGTPAPIPAQFGGDPVLSNSGQFAPMAADNTGGAVLRAMPTTGSTVAASSDPLSQFEFTPGLSPVAPVTSDMGSGLNVMPMPAPQKTPALNTSLMDPAFGAPVPPITMNGIDQMTTAAQDAMVGMPALDPSQPLDYPGIPVPVQKPLAPLPAPKQVKQYEVAAPSAPAPSFAPPPPPSGMDVWQGQSNYGVATDGSTLSRNPDGSVSRYSAKYDRWDTMNPQTGQWLPGGGANAMGSIGDVISAPVDGFSNMIKPSSSKAMDTARGFAGGAAGSMAGGALGLGPIGALVGAALGKSLAQGNGFSGMFNTPQVTQPATQATYDQLAAEARRSALKTNGGSFQPGSSNPSDYSYSPAAHDMANAGMGGLF